MIAAPHVWPGETSLGAIQHGDFLCLKRATNRIGHLFIFGAITDESVLRHEAGILSCQLANRQCNERGIRRTN
jgi:hypothetical protein